MFKKLFSKDIFRNWKTSFLGSAQIVSALYDWSKNPEDWRTYLVQILVGLALLYAKEVGIVTKDGNVNKEFKAK